MNRTAVDFNSVNTCLRCTGFLIFCLLVQPSRLWRLGSSGRMISFILHRLCRFGGFKLFLFSFSVRLCQIFSSGLSFGLVSSVLLFLCLEDHGIRGESFASAVFVHYGIKPIWLLQNDLWGSYSLHLS